MRTLRDLLVSEKLVVGAIVLNTAALFVLASTDSDNPLHHVFFAVDYACVVFFILEAILKIGMNGFRAYWGSAWNRFDFTVVVLSLPVLVEPLDFCSTGPFAVVLVLRVGRLFRLFRALRFIPNRDHLITGVKRALKASVGVFIALALVNIIFAIGAAMLFRESAPELFGNPALAIYSTFKVFTIEGWWEIPDAIAAGAGDPAVGVLARIFFVVAVLVGGIIGLSLANAVFVDEMTMDNTNKLEDKVDALLDEMRALREELRSVRRDPGE
jgi:voltage-gated sodium channel